MKMKDLRVCIFGLGYVGLPLAIAFQKHFPVVGYDINEVRVRGLKDNFDKTGEHTLLELESASNLSFTSKIEDVKSSNFYIVSVPTPVNSHHQPDLSSLQLACKAVAECLNCGDYVIFESTVYPGCTEEVCIPILEAFSGKKINKDFFCGYSPERVNPGDKSRSIESIVKITSGSSLDAAIFINSVYQKVIRAGTYMAESIMVAEAAKVIENTQRDLNIALMNELSVIFNRLNIDTDAVLNAAATKWNFMKFKPGLVGGHCIGVDPYYLTYKAESLGYHPEMILAGRRLNDSMGFYVASQFIKELIKNDVNIRGSKILIIGFSFKENCPDVRNTKVIDIYKELLSFGCEVDIFDPIADYEDTLQDYAVKLVSEPINTYYDGIILAVPHALFIDSGIVKLKSFGKQNHIFFDVKSAFHREYSNLRL